MGFLTDALAWLAMGEPFIEHPTFTDTASWANLQHALQTHSAYNATYPFTSTTLFHSYANFGGSGATLALIIAIFIFSKRKDYRTVCKWSIFPAGSVLAGRYIYQGVVKHFTTISVSGNRAQHSDLPQNEQIIDLIKRYILD